jgi:hypothetical protein
MRWEVGDTGARGVVCLTEELCSFSHMPRTRLALHGLGGGGTQVCLGVVSGMCLDGSEIRLRGGGPCPQCPHFRPPQPFYKCHVFKTFFLSINLLKV